MIEEARRFAKDAHQGQMYGERPYTYHLEQVVRVLQRFDITSPELLCAGWLHDSLEDTATTVEDLREHFGSRVADLVDAVTDGDGPTRELRKVRPYGLIPKVQGAVLLKLADRIANLEASIDEGHDRLLRRYAKEHTKFMEALYDGHNLEMWERLEEIFALGRCDIVCSVVPVAANGDCYDNTNDST